MKGRYTSIYSFMPGVLYRCWSENGTLLYIGATSNLAKRQKQHALTSPWWSLVSRVSTESFDHRWQAMAAERAAIVNEQPLFNRQRHYIVEAVSA